MSSPYAAKPWLALYDDGVPAEPEIRFDNALQPLLQNAERFADRPALIYFDSPITYRELGAAVAAFAAALSSEFGVGPGDRVMLQLQNMPAFFIAQYAVWTLGAVVVPVNPMFREAEIVKLAADAEPTVLVQVDDLYADRHTGIEALGIKIVTVSPLDFTDSWPADRLGEITRLETVAAGDMAALLEKYAGQRPEPAQVGLDDTAYLVYTSGTTGPPKGAMNTHRAVLFNSENYRIWCDLDETDVCVAMAPLFHVTGLIGHVGVGTLTGMTILLGYRFDPVVTLRQIEKYAGSWIIGAITAYIALLHHPAIDEHDLGSLSKAWSGGQSVSAATVQALQDKLGVYVHNIYGLTETTSQSHAVPGGRQAPVDPASGALAVGVPCPGYACRVIGENGDELPPGEVGEILSRAHSVVSGYWNKPEESAKAIQDGWLHTGDVGFMDEDGWFYIVDRIKDMIVASGFKIWPREVEDVLYQHPAVLETAVIGVPDDYRGETVAAFVSLRPGQQATPEEIRDFCKERLAAYKYPRQVHIVEEIPKNASGKILRRELRSP